MMSSSEIIDLLDDDDDDDLDFLQVHPPIFAQRPNVMPLPYGGTSSSMNMKQEAKPLPIVVSSTSSSVVDDDDSDFLQVQPIFTQRPNVVSLSHEGAAGIVATTEEAKPVPANVPTSTPNFAVVAPTTSVTTTVARAPSSTAATWPRLGHRGRVLGSTPMAINGLCYHSGTVSAGETVQLIRERNNTVRVVTTGKTIGHIEKKHALKLAQVMDTMSGRIEVQGTIAGNGNAYSQPVTVTFLVKTAIEQNTEALESYLRGLLGTVFQRAPQQQRVTPSPTNNNASRTGISDVQAELMAILLRGTSTPMAHVEMSTETTDWAAQQEELDKMFDAAVKNQLEGLPQYPMPPEFDSLDLFDYQKAGIRWLIHQERNDDAVPPWFTKRTQLGREFWHCDITKCLQDQAPKPIRGGILADDMGLGKTLQTLGLILSNPPEGQRCYPFQNRGLLRAPFPRCTLIVCPLSVMANWTIQINKYVNVRGRQQLFKMDQYHGKFLDVVSCMYRTTKLRSVFGISPLVPIGITHIDRAESSKNAAAGKGRRARRGHDIVSYACCGPSQVHGFYEIFNPGDRSGEEEAKDRQPRHFYLRLGVSPHCAR
jgi:SNF2-related domain